jgi:hypothetical protein
LLQMRKLIVVIMLIMSSCYVMAQATTDLGVQVAAATYWGDIENVNYSKSITPVVGILGRYNFNKRLAIRGQLFTGNLKAEGFFANANIAQSGQPRIFPEYYPVDPDFIFNFNRSFQSVEALFEFNFRDYKLGRTKKDNYTPFVSVGLGGFFSRASRVGSFILEPTVSVPATATSPDLYAPYYLESATVKLSNNSDVLTLTIPVGVGLKFNITKRLGGIIEVIVRKTFADNIDNLDDPQRFKIDSANPQTVYNDKVSGIQLNNNDWYATLAVSLCYQLWSSKGNCSIYDKIKK